MEEQQSNYNGKKQTIFRTIKNKDNPFVMMDRRPVENETLSWGAKGVLAYLLSRPDNWTVRLQDLVNRSPDGVYKIRGYIRELKNAGHVHRAEHRDPVTKRIIEYTLEVYELPFSSKPLTNLPQAGNLHAGNLTLNDTDLNNTLDEDEGEQQNIFKVYTEEIGLLTPSIADALEGWLKEGMPQKWICDAIREASANNARSMKYINAILKRWDEQGNQNPVKKQGANHANRNTNYPAVGKQTPAFDPALAEQGRQIMAERRAKQQAGV